MTTTTTMGEATDADLWRRAREGSREAFEEVVKRHQGAVTAVAFSARGDLAASEDIAQEAFWAAWRGRDSLQDLDRLRPWLCGIARNLAANAARRAAARSSAVTLAAVDVADDRDDPTEAAESREEWRALWRSLEALPDAYREPLILYYRQDQSVAEVAATLELTEAAVKQRLARGRAMLRDRLTGMVEERLRRSGPGRAFTTAVMAGLGANLAAKPAAAGIVGAAAPTVASAGLFGAFFGSLAGLAGGWFGSWLPAQTAATVPERDLILRSGRRILLGGIAFTATIAGLVYFGAGTRWYMAAWIAAMVGFQGWILAEVLILNRKLRAARAKAIPADEPNKTIARRVMARVVNEVRGRSYRSRAAVLGLPLLDVQVADPPRFDGGGVMIRPAAPARSARGWIAVGDDARGVLLAIGGRAVGGIAIGGRALGVVAFGGIAAGVIGVGGLAVGGLVLGGAAIGWIAVGGLAAGAFAAGGVSLGWKLAIGGLAASREVAVGGASIGPAPVDPAAVRGWLQGGAAAAPALGGTIATGFRRLLLGGQLPWLAIGAAGVAIEAARARVMYRRRRGGAENEGIRTSPPR